MPRTKKAIETYEQFRRYIGDQFMPNPEEVNVFRAIYKEEMSQPNGELSWALMLVYLAGKAKGTEKNIFILETFSFHFSYGKLSFF